MDALKIIKQVSLRKMSEFAVGDTVRVHVNP